MSPVFIISLSYFLIGAVAILVINRKAPERSAELWKKYAYYFLIVHLVLISSFNFLLFRVLTLLILLLSSFEFFKIFPFQEKKASTFIILLFPYLLICTGFLVFGIFHWPEDHQSVYLIVFCFDGFSQLCGQIFGKKKFTSISPNKTIEGTIGGFVITAITCYFVLEVDSVTNLILMIGLIVSAFVGDLLASAYKRFCGVKDYSQLIPAHGGFLDRFDSFIFAGFVFFLINYI